MDLDRQRRRRHLQGLLIPLPIRHAVTATLVVAVTACSSGTPAGRRPSAPGTPPSGATAAAGTGYKGDVGVGVRVLAPGGEELAGARLDATATDGTLLVATTFGGTTCATGDPRSACQADAATLSIGVHVVLDLATDLVPPQTYSVRAAAPPPPKEVTLPLSGLAPGAHCLLVVVSEDARPVVEHELPFHGSASVVRFSIGTAHTDWCGARARTSDAVESPGSAVLDCGTPVLSTRPDRPSHKRRLVADAPVWAVAHCATPLVFVAIRSGAVDAFRVTPTSGAAVPMAAGTGPLLLVAIAPGVPRDTRPSATLADPVVRG